MKTFFVFCSFFILRHAALAKPLDAAFSTRLQAELEETRKTDPDLELLWQETKARAQVTSVPEFIQTLQSCGTEQTGAFNHDPAGSMNFESVQNFSLFNREIDEPPGLTPDQIRQHYQERAAAALNQTSIDPSLIEWQIQPDWIAVQDLKVHRQICLNRQIDPDRGLEYLTHEMVHFARMQTHLNLGNPKQITGDWEYARKTVLEPGNEVDAYLFQYSFAVRHRGLMASGLPGILLRSFESTGKFYGRREDLVTMILEDFGYYKRTLREDYQKALLTQMKLLNQQIAFAQQLWTERLKDGEALTYDLGQRSRVLNFLWPRYRQESSKMRNLQLKDQESQERLRAQKKTLLQECLDLKKRLRDQVNAPACGQ